MYYEINFSVEFVCNLRCRFFFRIVRVEVKFNLFPVLGLIYGT